MTKQPRKIVFDPPITVGPAGGSVRVGIKGDRVDWILVVRRYGGGTA